MSDDKNHFLLVLEKISEIGERTARMEVEQKNIKEDLEEVKIQDVKQNELLAEHIAGVKAAHARLENEIRVRELLEAEQRSIKSRVDKLEEAPRFRSSLKQYLLGLGGIAASIVTILKILKYLGLL
jgi:hypothetical protein